MSYVSSCQLALPVGQHDVCDVRRGHFEGVHITGASQTKSRRRTCLPGQARPQRDAAKNAGAWSTPRGTDEPIGSGPTQTQKDGGLSAGPLLKNGTRLDERRPRPGGAPLLRERDPLPICHQPPATGHRPPPALARLISHDAKEESRPGGNFLVATGRAECRPLVCCRRYASPSYLTPRAAARARRLPQLRRRRGPASLLTPPSSVPRSR